MDPAADSKPLVLMACGPPGHGKTFFSRSIAKALVGEENLLEIACGNIQDNADLFGSRMGGGGLGGSSDGELTAFLRQRSGKQNLPETRPRSTTLSPRWRETLSKTRWSAGAREGEGICVPVNDALH